MHASNIRQRFDANVSFLFVFLYFFFYRLAQRFCKTEQPLCFFAPADRMIIISLCQFVLLLCPSPQLIQQQCYEFKRPCSPFQLFQKLSDVYVLLFAVTHIFDLETACLFSFKWPLNAPEEDFSLKFRMDHPPPPLCESKGMFQFTVMSFCFLCNVADCH